MMVPDVNHISYMNFDFTFGTPSLDDQPGVRNDQAPGVDDGLPQRRGLDLYYPYDDYRSAYNVG